MNPYCSNCPHTVMQHQSLGDDSQGKSGACGIVGCLCEQFTSTDTKISGVVEKVQESILVQKARFELERAKLAGEEFPDFNNKVLEIVSIFASMGHSGSSAEYTRHVIDTLLRQKALSPLTDDPDEWEEHDPSMWDGRNKIWQNRRDSTAFSTDGGETYFYLDEVKKGVKFRTSDISPRGPRGKHLYRSEDYE